MPWKYYLIIVFKEADYSFILGSDFRFEIDHRIRRTKLRLGQRC